MQHKTSTLNGEFGLMIEDVRRQDLEDSGFQREAYALWTHHGGLIAVRGPDLAKTSPEQLMAWSGVFGAVEEVMQTAREKVMLPGFPILRIGNSGTHHHITWYKFSRSL